PRWPMTLKRDRQQVSPHRSSSPSRTELRVFDLNVACRPGAALTPLAGTFAQLAVIANTSTLPLHTCVGPCPAGRSRHPTWHEALRGRQAASRTAERSHSNRSTGGRLPLSSLRRVCA